MGNLVDTLRAELPPSVIEWANEQFLFLKGDALEWLPQLPHGSVDVVFADPPYFLSNDGTTCHAGKRVSVNKGDWDRSRGFVEDVKFHRTWITEVKRILKDTGTVWVSGTLHNIYQCGFILQELGFYLLNDIC